MPGIEKAADYVRDLSAGSADTRDRRDVKRIHVDLELLATLYRDEGLSTVAIARRLGGVSPSTILARLEEAGIPRRPRRGEPRKYPPAQPRPCEYCGEIFLPDPAKVARGAGRFCSHNHWNEWRRGRPTGTRGEPREKHAPARPSPCEYCGKIFLPDPGKVARGAGGRFCSYDHWNEWRRGRPQAEWRLVPELVPT